MSTAWSVPGFDCLPLSTPLCVLCLSFSVASPKGSLKVHPSMKVNLVNDDVLSAFTPTLLSLSFAFHF